MQAGLLQRRMTLHSHFHYGPWIVNELFALTGITKFQYQISYGVSRA